MLRDQQSIEDSLAQLYSSLPDFFCFQVSFNDVETFNQRLATTILEEYYRVYPYVCAALKLFIEDLGEDIPSNKDVYVSFIDVTARATYVLTLLVYPGSLEAMMY